MLFVEMEKHTQHTLNSFHLYSKRIDFQSVEVDVRQELHQPISNTGLSPLHPLSPVLRDLLSSLGYHLLTITL